MPHRSRLLQSWLPQGGIPYASAHPLSPLRPQVSDALGECEVADLLEAAARPEAFLQALELREDAAAQKLLVAKMKPRCEAYIKPLRPN